MKEDNIFSYNLDNADIRLISNKLETKSINQLKAEWIKEITFPNPYLQTIHFRYKWIIACLIRIGCDREIIKDIHKKNLEYEVEHPPIVYTKKKSITRKTNKITKSSPVKGVKRSDTVTLIKLSSNKSIVTSRNVAEDIMRDYPNQYKILENEENNSL